MNHCAARTARFLRGSAQKPCSSGNYKLLKTRECSRILRFSIVFDLFRTHYVGARIARPPVKSEGAALSEIASAQPFA